MRRLRLVLPCRNRCKFTTNRPFRQPREALISLPKRFATRPTAEKVVAQAIETHNLSKKRAEKLCKMKYCT